VSDEKPGRLGHLVTSIPEMTEVVTDRESGDRIARYTDHITAGGFSVDAIVTRLERLKFDSIVTGKTTREVLDEWDGST
jgi:hypothetical protein